MDDILPIPSLDKPQGIQRASQRSIPVEIQARDLLLLKLIYDLPYIDAAQISQLLPVGIINPQLRGYHDQRFQERVAQASGSAHPRVRREVLRRLQPLLHAKGGAYVQRHNVNNNSPRLYTIAPRAVDVLAAEFDLDAAALARSARNRD